MASHSHNTLEPEPLGQRGHSVMGSDAGRAVKTGVSKALDYFVIGAGRGAKSSTQEKAEKLTDGGAPLRMMDKKRILLWNMPDELMLVVDGCWARVPTAQLRGSAASWCAVQPSWTEEARVSRLQ
jgi:hypothetical protein